MRTMSDKRYKQLGNYIELVQERNKGAYITNLMGVSIAKKFIPSIANIIGTDLSNYRIVHPGNFAFCPVTSRNGEKITIARYKGKDDCIISQAYLPFRVIDENELDPDYLMMWVMRSEFDRYARFHSHGSVRELFSWEEMCNVYLPIPSIEEQRKIVAEYQAVEQRIENNNRLIKALEDTAQAIYHHTFVENIDPENLPEGWSISYLYDIGKFTNGLACQNFAGNGKLHTPVLKIRELNQGFADINSDFVDDTFPNTHIVNGGDLIFSWSATLLVKFWASDAVALNQHLFKVTSEKYPLWLLYFGIKQHIEMWKNLISAKATSMGHIKIEDLQKAVVFVPNKELLDTIDTKINPLINYLILTEKENLYLLKLKNLLLSKLS